MRLNVKGLYLKLGGDKTQVSRRNIDQLVDVSAMAQSKQQLRIKRWMLHYQRGRHHRLMVIVGAMLGLVIFPMLLLGLHLIGPKSDNPLGLFIALPIIACGLVTVWMLIRDLRRVDNEARRIQERHPTEALRKASRE